MKRILILAGIFIFTIDLPVRAQDSAATAAAIAAKQDADERYKRLAADLQAVQSDNEALHTKISSLEQEIQTLRDAQAKPSVNAGMEDELKNLAEKIKEVDNKRMQDKDAISEEIQKSIRDLEKSLGNAAMASHDSDTKPARVKVDTGPVDKTPAGPSIEKGFTYTIKDGDTLGAIVKAYNAEFKSKGMKTITLRQAMEANPNVKWNRLIIGQKVIIPNPNPN